MIKEEQTDVGYSHKITLCEALCMKRYDWVVFLIKKWSINEEDGR